MGLFLRALRAGDFNSYLLLPVILPGGLYLEILSSEGWILYLALYISKYISIYPNPVKSVTTLKDLASENA